MVSIDEAKKVLPALVLVNGEDLTPYRAESKQIMAVLGRYGVVQRSGLDEGAVDITAQVKARLQCGFPALSFSSHILGWEAVSGEPGNDSGGTFVNVDSTKLELEKISGVDTALLVGSQVVSEMRSAIEKETGFQCSCGVAQNKMLAKLASSLNKPSKQTCLLSGAVERFIAPLPARKIPGVGRQTEAILLDLGVQTITDLKKVSVCQLSERLGARIGQFLYDACRGRDYTPVLDKGPPKSITVEDSFRNCTTLQQAEGILRVLAPDLIKRLDEDRVETGRRPKSLTLKWRVQGPKWNFISVSTDLPVELLSPSLSKEQRAAVAVEVASRLLLRNLGHSFHLVVLNIGATNFVETSTSDPAVRDIRSFLQAQGNSPRKELKVTSKNDARARRESFKTMTSALPAGPTGAVLGLNFSAVADSQKTPDTHIFGSGHVGDEYQLSNSSDEEDGWRDLADQLKSGVRASCPTATNFTQTQSYKDVSDQLQSQQSTDLLHSKSIFKTSHPAKLKQFFVENEDVMKLESPDSQRAGVTNTGGLHFRTQTAGSSRIANSIAKREVVPESTSQKKKRKSRNGTLDAFVIRK
ncbi:hypothetical protein AXG93_1452s1010 [Marchantia polymorpha subsp. ruderalis]|nr:hypothetical protein AXG93_1452s1010 [Marchantia polymorpha subsp. ruderalis]